MVEAIGVLKDIGKYRKLLITKKLVLFWPSIHIYPIITGLHHNVEGNRATCNMLAGVLKFQSLTVNLFSYIP